MTDNEIKKALECLEADTNCSDCALYDKKECKGECVFTNALDLINRLQEELNQYAEEHRNLMAKIEKKDKDIEKWQQVNFDLCTAGGKLLHERKTIRAEAYKEFAELVKANKRKLFNYIYSSTDFDNQIDNLLKEKVGDK